jgi:hypothetical protein
MHFTLQVLPTVTRIKSDETDFFCNNIEGSVYVGSHDLDEQYRINSMFEDWRDGWESRLLRSNTKWNKDKISAISTHFPPNPNVYPCWRDARRDETLHIFLNTTKPNNKLGV